MKKGNKGEGEFKPKVREFPLDTLQDYRLALSVQRGQADQYRLPLYEAYLEFSIKVLEADKASAAANKIATAA